MIELIPEEELRRHTGINFAPMVDFLFLIIAVFAVLLVARSALYHTDVSLVTAKPAKHDTSIPQFYAAAPIVLSVLEDGSYKWIGPFQEYLMSDVQAVQQHLIPHKAEKPKILLKVDRHASWDAVAQLIFAVREAGFPVYPLYEAPEEMQPAILRGAAP